ncbi:MAG: hypothetical protein AVDCRST_MAG25-3584 [uncultured Rubrobacteraceae bacterium]|uniref:DUF2795 domain-containing protein n=1 Tax=uncultured Rubrobacteraceae bacterium TaxID=349277 RepID=A0A6J4SBL8_9ACTN|nr:MAG: hypothetical protein AVDCRST_MAG25-3584 [uncultured Rubrobacteraceae bacterium]
MDMLGGFNPQDIQKYLQGVNWPADKDQVAQTAEGNGAPQGMIEKIKGLGGGQFSGPQEVIAGLQGG